MKNMRPLILTVLVTLVLAALPFFVDPEHWFFYFAFLAFCYIIVAQAWNLVAGYTGQISLGQHAFFGLGAYTTGFIWLYDITKTGYYFDPVTMALSGLVPVVLAIVIGIYLGMGCFLDAVSMMVLTMPVVFPLVIGLGFDPIWFGVICVLMMNAGLITPPIGLNVNTIAGIVRDIPTKEVFKGAMPFLLAIYATTLIIILWPQIATILPAQMGR